MTIQLMKFTNRHNSIQLFSFANIQLLLSHRNYYEYLNVENQRQVLSYQFTHISRTILSIKFSFQSIQMVKKAINLQLFIHQTALHRSKNIEKLFNQPQYFIRRPLKHSDLQERRRQVQQPYVNTQLVRKCNIKHNNRIY
ncbi:hypothetical protein FGO68_gene12959 [Halteria grandinella]|uniref:Uncharacterized protein n=1 Tax=Halteria grandinella TaxID=5974 RepID=A0A8J8P2V7_HALGN|nr:hypothetical protein FGO68_gene12959 [Halteria grandinella]